MKPKRKKVHYKRATTIFTKCLKLFITDMVGLKLIKRMTKETAINKLTSREEKFYLFQNCLYSNLGKEVIRDLETIRISYNTRILYDMLVNYFKKCKLKNKIPVSGFYLSASETSIVNEKQLYETIARTERDSFKSDRQDLVRLIWLTLPKEYFESKSLDEVFEIMNETLRFILLKKFTVNIDVEKPSFYDQIELTRYEYLFDKCLQWKLFIKKYTMVLRTEPMQFQS